MTKLHISLTDQQVQKLDRKAERLQISRSELLRRIIDADGYTARSKPNFPKTTKEGL